ncbi:hypothetical protein [Oceaniovalibus sp. ACAM 378]|uniref:hypothetical protein n=1 Tax=Oceaniovalibus sp. ACAM 378 TaxID=2599923 RepID=UPI0011D4CBB9|nr:hypothetical protein [Oceaniovalibus sp. ACAM 378]TYB88028.1 hypothetical protein FQ320_12795 [Oceaniovalibus sp. ACAM 378]
MSFAAIFVASISALVFTLIQVLSGEARPLTLAFHYFASGHLTFFVVLGSLLLWRSRTEKRT